MLAFSAIVFLIAMNGFSQIKKGGLCVDYTGCSYEVLEEGGFLLSNVATGSEDILSVYLGPGAVYAVLPEGANARALYPYLRELLDAARVYLYTDGLGRYDPHSNSFSEPEDENTLLAEIHSRIYQAQPVYTEAALERMKDKLIQIDAVQRGYYRDESGALYLLRGETFRRASERDSEHIFRLCLYGGVIGAHRFAVGRWFTGIVYLLTCGLFLAGWLVDLLQLFMGIQKDKDGFLLCPLEEKVKKLKKFPIGICIAVVAIVVYFHSFQLLSLEPNQRLLDFLSHMLGGLSNSIEL